jgi:hypothetical protein
MFAAISAAALSLTAPSTPDAETAPVRLVAEQQDGGIELRVIGESNRAVEAGYALEVTSDAAAGGNRTTQRGRVALTPGVPATLMTLRMSNVGAGQWTARLRVEPVDGTPYEEVRRSHPDS